MLDVQDWEMIRVFDKAVVSSTDKLLRETSHSATMQLDGDQTRQVMHLDSTKKVSCGLLGGNCLYGFSACYVP